MHKTIAEAVSFLGEIRDGLEALEGVDRVIAPAYLALPALTELLEDSPIQLAAQNMFYKEEGAYTGEVSPGMLEGLVRFVILGHSERRQYFGETDEGVNKKILAAVSHRLTPILCVGENLEQNESGITESLVAHQVRMALKGLRAADAQRLVIAYEPIWAIGTGRACHPDDAQHVIGDAIRPTLGQIYDEEVAQSIRIQYGGSVKVDNIADFMEQPDIDGALVGGASLKPSWVELTRIAAETKGVAS
jgi:triosephosphate isomerase